MRAPLKPVSSCRVGCLCSMCRLKRTRGGSGRKRSVCSRSSSGSCCSSKVRGVIATHSTPTFSLTPFSRATSCCEAVQRDTVRLQPRRHHLTPPIAPRHSPAHCPPQAAKGDVIICRRVARVRRVVAVRVPAEQQGQVPAARPPPPPTHTHTRMLMFHTHTRMLMLWWFAAWGRLISLRWQRPAAALTWSGTGACGRAGRRAAAQLKLCVKGVLRVM